jgi:hypothetical protein
MVLGAMIHEPRNLGRFCNFPKFTSFFAIKLLDTYAGCDEFLSAFCTSTLFPSCFFNNKKIESAQFASSLT